MRLIVLLFLFAFSVSATAAQKCADFSGRWEGTCEAISGKTLSLAIEQYGCDTIVIGGNTSIIGRISTSVGGDLKSGSVYESHWANSHTIIFRTSSHSYMNPYSRDMKYVIVKRYELVDDTLLSESRAYDYQDYGMNGRACRYKKITREGN